MQKEYIGFDSIYELSNVLKFYNANNILLVTGKNSFQKCGISIVLLKLLSKINFKIVNDFSTNPKYSEIIKIADRIKGQDFDVILAVGGGSVIDFAKSLNVKLNNYDKFKSIVIGNENIENDLLPFIAIPTTAGTGSEVTQFSVIYVGDRKYSLSSPILKPSISIVDPKFTYNLSPFITACSGLDAFCQAIESYWSVKSTLESKSFAEQSMIKIKDNLLNAIRDSDKKSRDEMMIASNLSGKAINITTTTAPHAISYPLTKLFNIPHGYAVALTLGHFFLINEVFDDMSLVQDIRGPKYIKNMMVSLRKILGWNTPELAFKKWYNFIKKCGLSVNLTELGIKISDIEKINNGVNIDRLSNNPVAIKKSDINKIFEKQLIN